MYVAYGGLAGLLFMLLLAVLFVGLIVWVAVTLNAGRRPRGMPSPGSSSKAAARAILDERYARGEVDRDDYLRRRTDLED
jgi:putative membrane protein